MFWAGTAMSTATSAHGLMRIFPGCAKVAAHAWD